MPVLVIGITGYDKQSFRALPVREFIEKTLETLRSQTSSDIELVLEFGLISVGVCRVAYEVALRLGIVTQGAARLEATDFSTFESEQHLLYGKDWVDEHRARLCRADGLIQIGDSDRIHEDVVAFRRARGQEAQIYVYKALPLS